MPTTRDDLVDHLAVHDAADLEAVLEAARVKRRGAVTPRELAERAVDALWWHANTPLGYVVDKASFEDIVDGVVDKLGQDMTVPEGDGWARLQGLTHALALDLDRRGVSLEDLDDSVRVRLMPSFWPQLLGAGGSAGAFGAARTAAAVIKLTSGPVGRLLPYLPYVGPWVKAIRIGAGGVSVVAGPLGVALAVVTVNQTLGADYHRLVPLLLGIGALGPGNVQDAVEL